MKHTLKTMQRNKRSEVKAMFTPQNWRNRPQNWRDELESLRDAIQKCWQHVAQNRNKVGPSNRSADETVKAESTDLEEGIQKALQAERAAWDRDFGVFRHRRN